MDPAPDDGTEAEKSFDDAYRKAEEALDEAVKAVGSAEALAAAAATAEERAAAREALSAAQEDLDDALEAARALSAPDGDDLRRGQAVGLMSRAEAAQRAQNKRIEDASASTQWSAGEAFARRPVPAALPEVGVVRRHRTNAAGTADNPDLLDAASFPAVPYAPGKVLISEGEASSGDPLRMRGVFPERIHDQRKELGNSFSTSITYTNQNSDLPSTFFFAGLRITGTGLVIEMGGRGSDGTDLRRQVWLAPNTGSSSVYIPADPPYPVDPWGWDLVLTFGEPTPSPEGNGERYWAARLMPDPGQVADGADATTRGRYLVDGQPYRIGTYNLWLSNHAGVETNLEPADPSETHPEDDVNSHLKYAAYGMMTFASSDRFERTTGLGWYIRDRVQAFHAGYDAFENKSGKRTTDIGEAVSGGKFTGLTIALELDGISRGGVTGFAAIDVPASKRLRGDVELTATISGTASDNAVKGRIRNLEVWDSRGYWKDYASLTDDIALGSGSIDADGQYDGTITGVAGFGDGEYGGSFYGPASDLETAGAWFLHGTNQGSDAVHRAIVGSFGAKRAPSE